MSEVQTQVSQVEAIRSMTNKEMVIAIIALQAQVAELQAKTVAQPAKNDAQREMTDDDARSILTGAHAASKHKDAAAALGLSYGQVYSCRLEYTFKHIHKELASKADYKNTWKK